MTNEEMNKSLSRIADAQEGQSAQWKLVKNELIEIKESIKRIDTKLDATSKETTINSERIEYLREQFQSEKKQVDAEINIVHESIRRRDYVLRWVAASIIVPVMISIMAFFNISPK